ncbi:MAG: response regulator transcription factor [Nitrosomonas sp.]|nr:response regulator transcription factor [Nitrosomonas sp.]
MNDVKILVIEDEKALRENITEIIAHYGFRVVAAATGEEGFERATEYSPDVIVCDIMLPGIDGYEVFTRIKQIPGCASSAFIFLTAKSTRSDTRTGMNMGADDYLTKPFTREELINSITARAEKLVKARKNNAEKDPLIEAAYEKLPTLTKAERKVLNKISEGLTTPQIAEKLFLSKKTIENHRMNISRKLDLSGPNSLINFALQLKAYHPDSFLSNDLPSSSSS